MYIYKHKLRYPRDVIDKILENENNWWKFFEKQAELTKNKELIPKKRNNGDYTTLCPIHEERTPSFRIRSLSGGFPFFKCFGCGHSGTFIKMIMETYSVSFGEAVEIIKKEKYEIIPRFSPRQRDVLKNKQEPSYDIDKVNPEEDDLPF